MRRLFGDLFLAFGLLALASLIAVQSVAYDAKFIARELLKLNSPQHIGMGEEDVYRYATHTAGYLRGSLADPNLVVSLNGAERLLLNERETMHMKDVQQLFTWARYVAGVLVLLLAVWGVFVYRQTSFQTLLQFAARGAVLAIMVATLVAFWISQDFSQSFTWFHLLSFSNDLWQLNPATDLLINLLPEQFFADAALLTAMRAVGSLALLALGTYGSAIRLRARNRVANAPR